MLKESRRPAPEAGTARGPQEPPRATAAGAAKAMEMSVVDRAQLMLLDLALNHGFIAHQLAEKLPPDVGEGPISKALHLVIGLAASDQWAEAGKRLAADPVLAQVPAIARVLVDPEFPPFDPAPVDEQVQARLEARLLKATADCLAKLERHCLDVEIRDAETALSQEPATERARELMRRLQSLQRQRAQLSIPAATNPA
jgi:predicted component of type VI protein secretion system